MQNSVSGQVSLGNAGFTNLFSLGVVHDKGIVNFQEKKI